MEFLNSIGLWLYENVSGLMAGTTAASLVATITYFISAFLSRKAKKKANEAEEKMLTAAESISAIAAALAAAREENAVTGNKTDDIRDMTEKLLLKLNAVLECESVKCQHISNTSARNAISGILCNAKYAEGIVRQQIMEELEQLRKEKQEMSEKIDEKVDHVNRLVTAEEKPIIRG